MLLLLLLLPGCSLPCLLLAMPGLLFDPHTEHFDHHNAPIAENYSSLALADAIAVLALQKSSGLKFLPSNSDDDGTAFRNSVPETEIFACDNFRMYEFKVRRCMRGRSHDWTECPFAHPGEKARRRDPRRVHYSGSPCPDFRKGSCRRGDFCEFAHGVFECWLHPARYRTQACKDGKSCKRRVCFFAHSPEQLRLLPVSVGVSLAHTVSMGDSPIHTPSMAGFSSQTVSLEGSPIQTLSNSQTVSVEVSPSQTVSVAGLPSHKVSMMGSSEQKVSMVGTVSQKTEMMGSSSACMLNSSSQKTSMLGPPSLVSPVTLRSRSLNDSNFRQALVHSFSTSEGYGGGGYPLSSATESTAEYFSGSDGSAGVPLGSSNPYLQSGPLGKGNDEVEEAAQLGSSNINLQLGFLGRSKYELSSHSYGHGFGFPSPTSTLAGHYYFPPPLSPPLSPLRSPNSDQTNGTFTLPAHGLHNLLVDATIPNRGMNDLIFIHNTDHKEDLGFTTQDLQSPHLFYHAQPSLQKLPFKHGKVDSTMLQLHQGSPSPPHVSHSLPCTTRQSRWSPLCNPWDSNGSGLNILSQEVETGHDLQVKIHSRVGEESPMDNLMPDVGWVSELVK